MGRDDGENFRALTTAFDVLSFERSEQETIFKILSSVLHIGNIYFKKIHVSILIVQFFWIMQCVYTILPKWLLKMLYRLYTFTFVVHMRVKNTKKNYRCK